MTLGWRSPSDADVRHFSPERVFEAGERHHQIANTAYPIAHHETWRPYRVARLRQEEVTARAWQGIQDLCLYAHIPFCEVRCAFCAYTVVEPGERSMTEAYLDRLEAELGLYRELLGGRTLHGFDIGGGTPSVVPAARIARLVDRVHRAFHLADGYGISIETTPRIAAADFAKMRAYREAGIGRISMGIQVIQPDLLKMLNRDQNGVEHHFRAVDHLRRAGFERFNVDLMYGFAGQSLASWQATLEHAMGLNPESITLYRMRYKLTRISHHAAKVDLAQVREQAEWAKRLLEAAGYRANPGKNTYSRVPGDAGTSAYLTKRVVEGMPYLGIGLGAQSFSHTTLSYNEGAAGKNLAPYLKSVDEGRLPLQDVYDLPLSQVMAKMAAVSFYFGEIDRAAFLEKFGQSIELAFPAEVAFVLERGFMQDTGRALSLTPLGARHFNGVIALFFAPSVQRHLIGLDGDFQSDRPLASTALR